MCESNQTTASVCCLYSSVNTFIDSSILHDEKKNEKRNIDGPKAESNKSNKKISFHYADKSGDLGDKMFTT